MDIFLQVWQQLQFHDPCAWVNKIPRAPNHHKRKKNCNSTSGRGARASYSTMFPKISARWSLFGRAELQIPVVTGKLGREGEKCLPLDHWWHIPLIHSTRWVPRINFCIYRKEIELFLPCGKYKCVFVRCVFDNYPCVLAETLNSRLRAVPEVKFKCYKVNNKLIQNNANPPIAKANLGG